MLYASHVQIVPVTPASIKQALQILASGGVIAHATETCYGLACDLTNQPAVEKLFAMKQRPLDQPVSALFATVEEAKRYVEWNERAEELATQYLPGPLTLILPLKTNAPQKIFPTPGGGTSNRVATSKITAGIRVSSHPLATELALRFGSPISTTSANIHGQPNPYSAEEIVAQFKDATVQPAELEELVILDSGTLPPSPPSTVINLASPADNGKVLRSGSVKPQ